MQANIVYFSDEGREFDLKTEPEKPLVESTRESWNRDSPFKKLHPMLIISYSYNYVHSQASHEAFEESRGNGQGFRN